jgi:hypothetical protein
MASDHVIRASDQDRDVVVAALRDAYTVGRLTLEEFDERMSAAYGSRTWGELRKLTDDLPVQPVLGGDVPGRPLPPTAAPQRPPRPGGPLPPASRHRHPVGFFPLVSLWIVLALASQSPHAIVAPTIALVIMLVFVSLVRRR